MSCVTKPGKNQSLNLDLFWDNDPQLRVCRMRGSLLNFDHPQVNAKQCDTLFGKLAGDVSCRFQVVMWSARDESKTLQHAASKLDTG